MTAPTGCNGEAHTTVVSPSAARVLIAIEAHVAERGYPPTVRELCEAVGLTVSTVQAHLDALVRAGRITRVPGQARTLRVVS